MKAEKSAQIQPKSQFHKNLPSRDFSIMTLDAGKYCVICDKFFTSKKILNRHKKTHSDLKSIHCPEVECDKAKYIY
jgi:uncharacterized Zn-finger protein